MPGASPLAASEGGVGFALAGAALRRRTGLDTEDRAGRLARFDALRRVLIDLLTHGSGKAETLHGSRRVSPLRPVRDENCKYANETLVHPCLGGWLYHCGASQESTMA